MTARNPDSVAVVTVNWNGWQTTLACLDALRGSVGADWHLFVVDNASTDASLDHLRGLGDDVTLVENAVNGGWTGGNNLGIERALAAGYPYIFILNNDAFVEPGTIARLVALHQEAGEQAIIGPIHLTGDGEAYDFVGTDFNSRTGLPLWKSVEREAVETLPDLIETSTIKGAGIFVSAGQLAKIGTFDDRFYLNFDETDWCYRARAAGYALYMAKNAAIRHMGSASIGGMTSPLQSYFLARNGLLFARRHCNAAQTVQLLREYWWQARDLPRDNPARRGWFWRFLTRPSPAQTAFKRGMIDFARGRFGDCPPEIRRLGRAA